MQDPAPPAYAEFDPHPLTAYNTPQSPPTTALQSHHGSAHLVSFVSGAPYFAMRPAPSRRCGKVTSAVLTLVPGDDAQNIVVPTPIRKSRKEVTVDDWDAFLNHLIPARMPPSRTQPRYEKSGTITTAPLPPTTPIIPSEQHLKRVVDEWNQGFFLPRGISIVLQTQQPPSRPPVKKSPSALGEALYDAVKATDIKTASLLLSHGADPSWRPTADTPQIVRAVKKNNHALLSTLLERGPDLEASAPGDGTALYYAIKAKSMEMVHTLLKYGASVNNAHQSGGEPALYRAVQQQDKEIISLLLCQPGVDLEKKPPGGATSLFRAAKDGDLEIVQLLLAHGAKAEVKEPGGATAMHKAVKRGELAMVQTLLEAGADVDFTPSGGNTALCEAVKEKDVDMVRLLLQYGADVNKKTCGSKSALARASKDGETELLELLLGGKQKE